MEASLSRVTGFKQQQMAEGKVYIGTSGWSYKHWKELFYPKSLKSTLWFDHYARFFDTTEINTSFYHLPRPETVQNWALRAPEGFVFAPKMSRFLTHMKKLHDPGPPLEKFFDRFAPLLPNLGPVLVQLPAMVTFKREVAEPFFDALLQFPDQSFVLEIRHESWLEREPIRLMNHYNVGLVISQSGECFPYSEEVTATNIYLRFHGPEELYASEYTDEQLKHYAKKIRKWVKEGYSVWAYFNNDIHGYAFADALRLKKILDIKNPGEPG